MVTEPGNELPWRLPQGRSCIPIAGVPPSCTLIWRPGSRAAAWEAGRPRAPRSALSASSGFLNIPAFPEHPWSAPQTIDALMGGLIAPAAAAPGSISGTDPPKARRVGQIFHLHVAAHPGNSSDGRRRHQSVPYSGMVVTGTLPAFWLRPRRDPLSPSRATGMGHLLRVGVRARTDERAFCVRSRSQLRATAGRIVRPVQGKCGSRKASPRAGLPRRQADHEALWPSTPPAGPWASAKQNSLGAVRSAPQAPGIPCHRPPNTFRLSLPCGAAAR